MEHPAGTKALSHDKTQTERMPSQESSISDERGDTALAKAKEITSQASSGKSSFQSVN